MIGELPPQVSEEHFFTLMNAVLSNYQKTIPQSSPQWTAIQVKPSDRVLQILAGPGSGKTEVLVWRVLYELFVNGASPASLLVTTFTRRAAIELEVRLVERADDFMNAAHINGITIADPRVHDVRIGTIHSLCDELLAEYDPSYVESGVQLVDETETLVRMMRANKWALGRTTTARVLSIEQLLSLFRPPWNESWPASSIDRARLLIYLVAQHTETWLPRCGTSGRKNGIESIAQAPGLTDDLIELQVKWEQYLSEQNILDFGTIQKRFTDQQHLLLDNFHHIFVDEFQDSNPIQFNLHTNWLNNPLCRLTVVGDDDQAIYRFRGSDLGCFKGLEPHCQNNAIAYRLEKLETNYRSSKTIVNFSQQFKFNSALNALSMPKTIQSPSTASHGTPVRLLTGPWNDICALVADELKQLGVGQVPAIDSDDLPSVGILLFSTSERTSKNRTPAAAGMRQALEAQQMRVYNPRAKTAAEADTPIGQLLGLISYLVDPISMAPAGKKNRSVEVFATHENASYAQHALTQQPSFPINVSHSAFQKKFRKAPGSRSLTSTTQEHAQLLDFVDQIRENLTAANSTNKTARLTLASFVARLLAQPFFRNTGFTIDMFRQSLFTQLLEANIAPTRLTMQSLDQPLDVTNINGKYVWSDRFWGLLHVLGSYIASANLDDPDIEAFEENAVPLITFHQAKGLEFDHVYVASMGREPDVSPALRTALFSGEVVNFQVINGVPATTHQPILDLATADRDRENYVALTRAKQTLTLLLPSDRQDDAYSRPHPAIDAIFNSLSSRPHQSFPNVTIKEWRA